MAMIKLLVCVCLLECLPCVHAGDLMKEGCYTLANASSSELLFRTGCEIAKTTSLTECMLQCNSTHGWMVIFGGFDGNRLNDAFTLNLLTNVWSPLSSTGTAPSPRSRHSAIHYTDASGTPCISPCYRGTFGVPGDPGARWAGTPARRDSAKCV